jgi:hypothetical protein
MYRRRRGIELQVPAAPVASGGRKPGRRRSKLDPFMDKIGKIPDADVAALAGVTPENVRAFRNRHKIAADYRVNRAEEKARPATPAPAPAPVVAQAPAPAAAPAAAAALAPAAVVTPAPVMPVVRSVPMLRAFSVQIDGADEAWVLFAEDVAKAAVRAMASLDTISPGGRIASITHLGRALA